MVIKTVTARENFGVYTYVNIYWVAKAEVEVPDDADWNELRKRIRSALGWLIRREYSARVNESEKGVESCQHEWERLRDYLASEKRGVTFRKIILYEDKNHSVTDKIGGPDDAVEVK